MTANEIIYSNYNFSTASLNEDKGNAYKSSGAYKNVSVKNIVLYAYDGVEMSEFSTTTRKTYMVKWVDDGTAFKYDDAKEATEMFLEFTGLTKRSLKKCEVKATV